MQMYEEREGGGQDARGDGQVRRVDHPLLLLLLLLLLLFSLLSLPPPFAVAAAAFATIMILIPMLLMMMMLPSKRQSEALPSHEQCRPPQQVEGDVYLPQSFGVRTHRLVNMVRRNDARRRDTDRMVEWIAFWATDLDELVVLVEVVVVVVSVGGCWRRLLGR